MPGAFGRGRTMKAWVLHGINDLRYEDRGIPCPAPGEALVRVRAAGICGSDIPRIFETGAHVHPIVPGHEFAGEVAACADSSLVGKRVGVFPLIPCGKCPQCRQKQYQLCRNYNYLGSRCDGGFAEYAKVPVWNLIEVPGDIPFELAALLEPLSVAVHAIRRANIGEPDSVAVVGLGAIGLFAVTVLMSMGVGNIYAVGNKPFQRDMALRLGLPAGACVSFPQLPPECGAVLECAGKPDALAAALRIAAPNGRIVAVGNPGGNMALEKTDYWRILRRQLTIFGTWNSSFTHSKEDDWHFALNILREHGDAVSGIISHRLAPGELGAGLQTMRDKTEGYGRILTVRK